MAINPFEDVSSRNTENERGVVGGAKKTFYIEGALKRFKQDLNDDSIAPRANQRNLEEAIQIIESLLKMKVPQNSPNTNQTDNITMTKILQEIQGIKSSISQNQSSSHAQGQSWAKIVSKPNVVGTTIKIQDEEEKRALVKLSSKELVEKIGMKEIIGARPMVNGQVKVYYAEAVTKQVMERQHDWTRNWLRQHK